MQDGRSRSHWTLWLAVGILVAVASVVGVGLLVVWDEIPDDDSSQVECRDEFCDSIPQTIRAVAPDVRQVDITPDGPLANYVYVSDERHEVYGVPASCAEGQQSVEPGELFGSTEDSVGYAYFCLGYDGDLRRRP